MNYQLIDFLCLNFYLNTAIINQLSEVSSNKIYRKVKREEEENKEKSVI